MDWTKHIKAALPEIWTVALLKKEEKLYTLSRPLLAKEGSGLTQRMKALWERSGITRHPELRLALEPDMYISALPMKNSIIVTEEMLKLPSEAQEGFVGHETGHNVFMDEPTMRGNGNLASLRKCERRGDRFSHFLTGDPSGLAEALQNLHFDNKKAMLASRKIYGTTEDRVAALNKPLDPVEVAYFKAAIARHNAGQAIETGMTGAALGR